MEALEAGIDVLWIGARTTVNPFAVQQIVDALKGIDIPVMVKNLFLDLELWLGAFERLNNSGITKLAAIHRGFIMENIEMNLIGNSIELKRRFPERPLLSLRS